MLPSHRVPLLLMENSLLHCSQQGTFAPAVASPKMKSHKADMGCADLALFLVKGPEKGAGAQDVLSLEAISGPCEGTVYSKAGDVLSVGRTRASKLHIKDAAVSERHAEVRWETDRWTVTDVGSSNGTAVNGQPLIEGTIPVKLLHVIPPCCCCACGGVPWEQPRKVTCKAAMVLS